MQGSGVPLRSWGPECPTVTAQQCSAEIPQWTVWTEESIQSAEEVTKDYESGAAYSRPPGQPN